MDVDRELIVGREDADLTIGDPELSRRHAALRPVDRGVEIEDLKSLNGTIVNGQRISATVTLTASGTIKVGKSELQVEVDVPQATEESERAPVPLTDLPDPDVTAERKSPAAEPDVTAPRPLPGIPEGRAARRHGPSPLAAPVGTSRSATNAGCRAAGPGGTGRRSGCRPAGARRPAASRPARPRTDDRARCGRRVRARRRRSARARERRELELDPYGERRPPRRDRQLEPQRPAPGRSRARLPDDERRGHDGRPSRFRQRTRTQGPDPILRAHRAPLRQRVADEHRQRNGQAGGKRIDLVLRTGRYTGGTKTFDKAKGRYRLSGTVRRQDGGAFTLSGRAVY